MSDVRVVARSTSSAEIMLDDPDLPIDLHEVRVREALAVDALSGGVLRKNHPDPAVAVVDRPGERRLRGGVRRNLEWQSPSLAVLVDAEGDRRRVLDVHLVQRIAEDREVPTPRAARLPGPLPTACTCESYRRQGSPWPG